MTSLNMPTLTLNDARPPMQLTETRLGAKERDDLHKNLSRFVGGLIRNSIDLDFARKELDYFYISQVLRDNGGNIGRAAKKMGMHRNTLSKRIKELNIPVKALAER